MYAAEAEGLAALRAAGVRAPEPYAHGVRGGEAYLEMEHLDLGGPADWPAMARMLAGLHRHAGERYGWPRDNWIGLAPQRNVLLDDWAAFFRDYRLIPQLEQAQRNGHRFEAGPLFDLLAGHRPQPCLLHGDLWSGNAGFTPQGPALFDPAVYYGDREADLAMSELFGGFPREFYAAYREAWPLDSGYKTRKHLYNFYHLLNHLNLFGGGYLGQVKAALRLLRR